MKNIILYLGVVIAMTIPSTILAQNVSYTINGNIGTLPATAKAYLLYRTAGERKTDSTSIINGHFSFAGNADVIKSAYLMINKLGTGARAKGVSYISVYIEPGTITINSPDSLANAKITGGPVNADNQRLTVMLAAITKKMDVLNNEYESASEDKKNSKEFSDYIEKRSDSLENEEKAIYLVFIKANPNSLMSLFSLKNYGGYIPDIAQIQPLYNSLSANVRTSREGVNYAAEISEMKKTAIGALAPDFTMADTSGKAISLHDFKGKYVLVDFWASWCGPCREENPNVVKAYGVYKNKNFTVLGVSLDAVSSKKEWIKAINDDHLFWAQVSDLKGFKNAAALLYNVKAIPQNFLIGPDGKIVAKNLRGDELDNKLSVVLAK